MTDDTEKQLTRQQRWRKENPERYRAHLQVAAAIRAGRLVPMPCRVCGHPKTDAHHRDYRRPLLVEWLCRSHHTRLHRGKTKGRT
ncbi:hypothetical protein [Pararhizobium sp. O133]|uniref:hypothetical protein n=1 Tax=Pararhizobium sp. O133 TaxID=3449278 RepID=UPI003F688030